ncbi:MAG: TonB-dependent receptor [Burkholderiaceae bacterium]|jgi:vitamin B12 transporter|nr:TonB-dependent receptor [Burkholderiaceae bacterium]
MSIQFCFSRPSIRPLGLACLLLTQGFASAQATADAADATAADTLPETVVTATRVAQPLTDVLADVTILDGEQIRASGAVNITDLLQRQAGVALSRNGGPGTTSSLFLRGADARFTAVYIDGIRVDTQSTGGAPWESIALGQVDRVEIVRGPAAAVYGSDAVAGVIQIFTRKGEGTFTPYVGAGAGSRRAARLEAGFSGQSGAFDYSLSAGRDLSRGYNIMDSGNPDRDGYRQSAASTRLGYQISAAHRVELTGTTSRNNVQYDGYGSTEDDHTLNRLGTLGATWSAQWSAAYGTRLSVSESSQRYETTPSPYLTKTRLRNALLQNELRLGAHLLTATLERREDHLSNDPIDQGRHQNALGLGWGYTRGAHSLQVNVRHDRDSEFGGQTTGGAAYGYTFAPGWRVTAAAGTSFRVPTLYQRFSEYGNPGLVPEKGRNVEAGLHWARGASRFDVTAWRNHIRSLISFGAPGPCGALFGCYENTGRAVLKGITFSGAHQVAGVNIGASLDLQKPHDAVTGKLLARRAQRTLKLNADTRVAGIWTLGAEWQLSSRRYDNAANTTVLGGYGLLNLYASATIARAWDLLARVDNVGGRDYELARGYAQPGRTFYLGVRWTPRN